MSKKVLLITYYWPPAGGIAVVRWVKFVKYLRRYGWEPIVYTVSNASYPMIDPTLEKDVPEGLTIIKRPIWEPHNLYRFFSRKKNTGGLADIKPKDRATLLEQISNWLRSNFFIPDARAFWIRPSVRFLIPYLRDNPVDAIVSTGPPHSAHLIALGLKDKLGIPWLADFRDPWTTMDYYKELLLTRWADRKHRNLELDVLKRADAVVVVGNGMKKEFEEKSNRAVTAVTNGFDEEDFSGPAPELDPEFSIVHVGTFFSRINPQCLWQALREFLLEDHRLMKHLKIKLTGRVDPTVITSIREAGLEQFMELNPVRPHDEAVIRVRSAQVLLLCVYEQTKFVLTGKLFEYLAAKRPIICIGPTDGDAANIVEATRGGKVFSFDSREAIKQHLSFLFDRYEKGKSQEFSNDAEAYSHRVLTQEIADQLNTIIKH